MRSSSVLSTLLLLTLLVPASRPGIAQETATSAPGVYLLVEVNGKALPSVSGTRNTEGQHYEDEALEGALLLDSDSPANS